MPEAFGEESFLLTIWRDLSQ